jgi:hypothetical protein
MRLAVYKRSIRAMIDNFKTITFPDDFRMISRNNRRIFGKTDLAIHVTPNSDNGIRIFFYLPLERPLNMNELDDDDWFFRHMIILNVKYRINV